MSHEPDLGATIARFIDRKLTFSPLETARPAIVGLCGAQGIGKSTVSGRIVAELEARGLRTLVVGLDDIYLPRRDRAELARTIHPLLQTRGVPGTHDIALGLALLDAANEPAPLVLPRFDKAIDDRLPREQWPVAESRPDIILLEGWCIGAVPQSDSDLAEPVNALERLDDPEGRWRGYVNDALAVDYQRLFAKLDMLILMAAPNFEIVATWRYQQEVQLCSTSKPERDQLHTMNKTDIDRFVLHYERLTRHILREMPDRADLVLRLDTDRRLAEIGGREKALLQPPGD